MLSKYQTDQILNKGTTIIDLIEDPTTSLEILPETTKSEENFGSLLEETPQSVEIEENFGNFLTSEDSKFGAKLEMKEDGTFQCKSCDYKTTRKGNMRNHKRVHSSNSLFKCPSEGCMFKTKRKGHMQTHDEAKHKGLRFDCNLCDYQTAYRKDLGKHIEKKNTQVGLPLLPGLFVISKLWTTMS